MSDHESADFETMPDLVCGNSYRNPESEAQAVAMRTCEVTPYTGCGKPMRWVYAYRCRQCGRWLHGPCMDRHFGLAGCPATRGGQTDLTAENERLRWAISGGKGIIDGQAARIRALTSERDEARAWSARWKAVAKRIWNGVHHPLDMCELQARRREAAEAERDALAGQVAALREALKASRRTHMDVDGDPWFSCPMARGGSCLRHDMDGRCPCGCTCGADEHNASIDAALAAAGGEAQG